MMISRRRATFVHTRTCAAALMAMAMLVVAHGCVSRTGPPPTEGQVYVDDQRVAPRPGIEPPVGLDRDRLMPLTGDRLRMARKSLDQVVVDLQVSTRPTTDQPTDGPTNATAPATDRNQDGAANADEPGGQSDGDLPQPQQLDGMPDVGPGPADDTAHAIPLAAQRAYAHGRAAWREGDGLAAITEIQKAIKIAGDHPHLLRQLGRLYIATGNRALAQGALERAIAADSDDCWAMFLLGKVAFSEKHNEQAVRLLARALLLIGTEHDQARDPAMASLMNYYLAAALQRMGYYAAAIDQFHKYRSLNRSLIGNSLLARELRTIDRQRSGTWVAVGDMFHQLDRPDDARQAYQRAAEMGHDGQLALMARLIYTYVRLGYDGKARTAVSRLVENRQADSESLALVRYLPQQGVDTQRLSSMLDQLYRSGDRPVALVLTLAQLQDDAGAQRVLLDHLRAKPGDAEVLDALLKHVMPGDATPQPEPGRVAQALAPILQVLADQPTEADRIARAIVRQIDSRDLLADAINQLGTQVQQRPSVRMLDAMNTALAGNDGQAIRELKQLIQEHGSYDPARIILAHLYVAREQWDLAAAQLAQLKHRQEQRLAALRVRVLMNTGQSSQALALIDQLIDKAPADTDLIVAKAKLLISLDRGDDAQQLLLDALNTRPTDERLYAALFDYYDSPAAGADATQGYQRLMRRMLRTIPQSRIARLKLAELHQVRGDHQRAHRLLLSLLEENRRDLAAYRMLVQTLIAANQKDVALELIDQQVRDHPKQRGVLRLSQAMLRSLGEEDRAWAVAERLLLLEPAGLGRDVALAGLYLSTDRASDVEPLLEPWYDKFVQGNLGDDYERENLVRLPVVLAQAKLDMGDRHGSQEIVARAMLGPKELRGDIGYLWASVLYRAGREREGRDMLAFVLKVEPTHAPSNNDLGYQMTLAHEDLERAKQMIAIAVAAEPTNASYLDSMGWVLYKLGDFQGAVDWLGKARAIAGEGDSPVVIDHLGDALYRVGQVDQARAQWRAAQVKMLELKAAGIDLSRDPEMSQIAERLPEKIKAVSRGQEPPVAQSPGFETRRQPAQRPEDRPIQNGQVPHEQGPG